MFAEVLSRGFVCLEILSRTSSIPAFPDYREIRVEFDPAQSTQGERWDKVPLRFVPIINIMRFYFNLPLIIEKEVREQNDFPDTITDPNTWELAQTAQRERVNDSYYTAWRKLRTDGTHASSFCSDEMVAVLESAYKMHVQPYMKSHFLMYDTSQWNTAMTEYRNALLEKLPLIWRTQKDKLDAEVYHESNEAFAEQEHERAALRSAKEKLELIITCMDVGTLVDMPLPCRSLYNDLLPALKQYEHGIRWVSLYVMIHSPRL